MSDFSQQVISRLGRRTFLRRSSAAALAGLGAVIGLPASNARANEGSSAEGCAIYCSPSQCSNTGCGGGDDIYHCIGCGYDFYRCFSKSRGCRGFCFSQAC